MTFTNAEKSAEFAKFLIEEYRDMSREEQISAIRERFPDIQENEFMRAFAIAEEIAVADAESSVELLKTNKPLPPFHDDFQCCVISVSYDFTTKLGTAVLHEGHCADMVGSIRFFHNLDETVERIVTIGGGARDTLYLKQDGEWRALFGKAA
ncbi:hypothetical protein ACI0FM_03085 [Paenochrobactrum sp. BZR 588]|uniref:hypothetical protein n=1 Tax=unclassified Paenochrobactrum TaxID=2639760 RepID=UPI003855409C